MKKVLHMVNRKLGVNKFKYAYIPGIVGVATAGLLF